MCTSMSYGIKSCLVSPILSTLSSPQSLAEDFLALTSKSLLNLGVGGGGVVETAHRTFKEGEHRTVNLSHPFPIPHPSFSSVRDILGQFIATMVINKSPIYLCVSVLKVAHKHCYYMQS